jgi:hypothetical protein
MNPYICKNRLVHHKPCKPVQVNGLIEFEPSSNNGWIYGAYLKKVHSFYRGPKPGVFESCKKDMIEDPIYFIYRLPDKQFPPISRDEIIGMISLGYNPFEGRRKYFLYEQPGKLTWKHYWKAIDLLEDIKKKHRNHFWENEMYDTFPVAMKLWWHDRYYVDIMTEGKSNVFNHLAFIVHAWNSILFGSHGDKNLIWLQLKDLGSKYLVNLLNWKRNFKKYFPADHPIVETIMGRDIKYETL